MHLFHYYVDIQRLLEFFFMIKRTKLSKIFITLTTIEKSVVVNTLNNKKWFLKFLIFKLFNFPKVIFEKVTCNNCSYLNCHKTVNNRKFLNSWQEKSCRKALKMIVSQWLREHVILIIKKILKMTINRTVGKKWYHLMRSILFERCRWVYQSFIYFRTDLW